MAGAGKRGRQAPQDRVPEEEVEEAEPRKKKLGKKELVGPLHVPVEPLTSQAVEDATNAALQNQPDGVHGATTPCAVR